MSRPPEHEKSTIPHGGENPDKWEHPQINDAFSPLMVKDATDQADKYWQMRQLWEQGVETFIRSTQASLAQAWSGPAAEQSKQAIQDYIDNHARPVTPALEELSGGVRAAADAIVKTKNSLGDPLTTSGFKGFLNELFNDGEISRRTQEARAAMTTNYVTPFAGLDSKVPVIPVPVGPTTSTDIPAPPPGGYNNESTNPTSTDSGNPNGTTPGGTPEGETPAETEEQPQSETPGEQTDQPTTADPGDTATDPAATETPTGAPTIPASTAPAGVNTPSAPGLSTPGSPGATTPEPGRTVQGAPNATGTPVGTGAAAANAAAGTRGMNGMPMGGAGGGRGGGKDDESERKTPDYLVNQENTDELLGEMPRTIPGGVIGANPD
ncbi:hypothetical protein [Nocardia sp. NBC_00416]|uniref:hypothetical protein n=1 Tax=Nocardia sp. NBC_00416 TaxID=2975991 RepID=UPI002E2435A5